MQVLVKNWLVGAEKTEVAHLWAAVNVWLKYRSCLVGEVGFADAEPFYLAVTAAR